MNTQHEDAGSIRVAIMPEPTDEEIAAVAAVVTALAASSGTGEREPEPAPDRWSRAGRQEALRGPLWPAGGAGNVRE